MVVTLTGNNSYLLRQRLSQLVNDFVKEQGELALQQIDGEEAEASAVSEAVQSLPFLAAKKMVVVRGLSNNKAGAEQIEQIISSVGDDTDLIFHEPSIDKRTVYFKVLKKQSQLEEYTELDVPQLAKWLSHQAQDAGGSLSFADANYLIERAGPNQELLANELQKLLTYSPEISRENIDLLSVKTPQSKVFDLLDAAFGGNKKRALQLYDEQRAQKVEPQEIIAMLAWQLNLIALAVHGKGKDSNQIAKDAGVNPYPVIKSLRLAERLNPQKIKDMVNRALYIDEKSKTTNLDLDEALKTYIVTL